MPYPNMSIAFDTTDVPYTASPSGSIEQIMLNRLAMIGKNYLTRYMNQCYTYDNDGNPCWRWEKYDVQLRIVSAANRYGNVIVMGTRHYSNSMNIAIDAMGGVELLRKYAGDEENVEQGFVDQYGTFHTRKEAWIIAEAAGQIVYPETSPPGRLFSEHLY